MVESQPSKLLVAGSIPVSRSRVCSELFAVSRCKRLLKKREEQIPRELKPATSFSVGLM